MTLCSHENAVIIIKTSQRVKNNKIVENPQAVYMLLANIRIIYTREKYTHKNLNGFAILLFNILHWIDDWVSGTTQNSMVIFDKLLFIGYFMHQ